MTDTKNMYWPLPADYPTLTTEGQRLARVATCSLTKSPEDAAISWRAFVKLYLWPDEGFDPGFYSKKLLTPPPGHFNFVKSLHQVDRVAMQAPRHWAKTTLKRSIFLWKLCTQPGIRIASFLSKDDFVTAEAYQLKLQFETNERLLADFGEQRPVRGSGSWTNHFITLANKAIFQCQPIESRTRGIRGDLVFLDDVEYDEDGPKAGDQLEKLKERCLKVISPMLGWSGGQLAILGTFLGKRSFLWHVVMSDDDDRFRDIRDGGDWLRINLPAVDSKGRNAWEAAYTPEFMEKERRRLGEAYFQSEYMGNPMSEDRCPFNVTSSHEYTVVGTAESPWDRSQIVRYTDSGQHQEAEWPQVVGKMTRVLTVDPASSLKVGADFSAITVGGVDSNNRLWLLDCWQSRVTPTQLAAEVWRLAEKWRVSLIAVESFGTYIEVFRLVRDWQTNHGESDWRPQVIEYKPPQSYSKEQRIMSLQWRFDQQRILFPAHLRLTNQAFRELYHQVVNFTPDGKGLSHDDLIDAVSAIHFVTRTATEMPAAMPMPKTHLERMLAGEVFVEGTTIPMAGYVPLESMTWEQLQQVGAHVAAKRQELFDQDDYPPEPSLNVWLGR